MLRSTKLARSDRTGLPKLADYKCHLNARLCLETIDSNNQQLFEFLDGRIILKENALKKRPIIYNIQLTRS